VDRRSIVIAALDALAEEGKLKHGVVAEAIRRYEVDVEAAAPWRT
jgi:pyruvate dehydrogenase E1 component